MKDEKTKVIVDSMGNEIKSKRENKLKQVLKNNLWKIVEVGIPALIFFIEGLRVISSRHFAALCADFYGVDKRYFDGAGLFEDKSIILFCAIALFIYPYICMHIIQKEDDIMYKILYFFLVALILLMQTVVYAANISDSISWNYLKSFINNYACAIILISVDFVIAYFMILRNSVCKKKEWGRIEKLVFATAFLVYLLEILGGIGFKLNYSISDKKTYEVIEDNRVIVSDYEGKFVVMDCEINNDVLTLKRGKYYLKEMTDVSSITYCEYKKVICE